MGGPRPLPLIEPPAWLGSRLGPPPPRRLVRPEPAGDEGGPRKGDVQRREEEAAGAVIDRLRKLRKILKRSATGREIATFLNGAISAGTVTVKFTHRSCWDGSWIHIRSDFKDERAALALAHEAYHARATVEGPNHKPETMEREAFVQAMLREEAGAVVQAIKVSQELGMATKAGSQARYEEAGQAALEQLLDHNPTATLEERQKVMEAAGFAAILKALQEEEIVIADGRVSYVEKYGKDWDDRRPRTR